VSLQSKISAAEALLANDATAAAGVTALKAIINEADDVAQSSNDAAATDGNLIPISFVADRSLVCLDIFFFFFFFFFFAAEQDSSKLKEQALLGLVDAYVKRRDTVSLARVLRDSAPFLNSLSKAKTAKLVRLVVDKAGELSRVDNSTASSSSNSSSSSSSTSVQLALVDESIAWATAEKRAFLRQRLESRRASLLVEAGRYDEAIELCGTLGSELKKLDDKLLLVEVRLTESQALLATRAISKAKAALTVARTNANSIYTPPQLTGGMDLLAGELHADEKDYKTAFSYFYEAFETFHQLERPEAHRALNYMLLTKILMNKPHEVPAVLTSKLALKYAGPQVDSLRQIAVACRDRSLHDFERAKAAFPDVLRRDAVVQLHLTNLYADLLERHLARLVEPYSVIELSRVAELMALPAATVEKHLSSMILDGKLSAILDQGAGHLILYDAPQADRAFGKSLAVMSEMTNVVDVLFEQANQLR
jgi:26S proteasome regulatory subunit N6